jgi:Zn-dependent M28 family amino/carboxypeptidase
MMTVTRFVCPAVGLAVALVWLPACTSETVPAPSSIRTNVEILASDAFEGRLTGTEGIRFAANHIVAELEALGAVPLPMTEDYRLPFQFTGSTTDGGTRVRIGGRSGEDDGLEWSDEDAVRALSYSESGEVTGSVVFAGYGLVVPETDGFSYDSYATLDVTDKIVVALRYFPEDAEQELRSAFSRYSSLRFKAQAARQRGARGLLVVTGPRSPNAGAMVPMTADTAVADSGIAAASISLTVADALLAYGDATLEEAQQALDSGNPHVSGFEIPVDVTLDTQVVREQQTGYNVVAYLPPTIDTPVDRPYVLLGAHYDHLGHGEDGSSLAKSDEAGEIHNGADDNASGVAAVLAAGAELAAQDRARGVVLAFWSGEELGLLGSADFVDSAPVPIEQIAAYLNFDMVGRLRDNKLSVQALGSSSIWSDLVDDVNVGFDFELQKVTDPYLPTDVMSFNLAEVPSLALFTGSHEDYHRPTDDTGSINFADLDRIARYGAAIAARLVAEPQAPDFVRVERTGQDGGQMQIRLYTGTIPDYASEVDGLLLSGVMGGGPAEKSGLQEGDVIVELAGQSIANIYDYTYALDLLRVGEPTAVVFVRDGNRIETELIPEVRQ